jgi:hypothetical protein
MATCPEEILDAKWHAVERPALVSVRDFGVGSRCGCQRPLGRHANEAREITIKAADPCKLRAREFDGRHLASSQERGKLRQSQKVQFVSHRSASAPSDLTLTA